VDLGFFTPLITLKYLNIKCRKAANRITREELFAAHYSTLFIGFEALMVLYNWGNQYIHVHQVYKITPF
jgi:hypothetical protein